MKILFIYSVYNARSFEKPLYTHEEMQFGISYISSSLKEDGHSTDLLVVNRVKGESFGEADARIEAFGPRMVFLTAVAAEYNFISALAGHIKSKYPGIFVIAGGCHISLMPDEAIRGPFDAICIGEGERPARELASQIESGRRPSGIMNLWIKYGAEVEKNPARPFIEDLDTLPFPDRRIWLEWIKEEYQKSYPIMLGRGCPFDCSYCCNHALKKIAGGKYVRFRSPESVVKEMEECRAMFPGHRMVYFEVESFSVNRDWALRMLSALKKYNSTLKDPLYYGTNIRITKGADLEGLFARMRECNFTYVNIGLESGSERVRRGILKRDYSNGDVINAFNAAKRNGLIVCFYNMIGIPGETAEDFRETVRINHECQPDRMCNGIFYPYPGTDIYGYCAERGLIKGPMAVKYERKNAAMDMPGMTRGRIESNYVWFIYNVYKGRKPRHMLLARVLRLWIWTKFSGNPLYYRLINRRPLRWFKVVEW